MNAFVTIVICTAFLACTNNPSSENSKDQLAREEKNRDSKTDTTSNENVNSPIQDNASRIRILSYNVLKYGDECQAPNSQMHQYLKTIIKYTSPDIIGLVKVGAFKLTPNDNAKGVYGFQDSIDNLALNAAFPGKYAVCPTTDIAQGNNMNLLFYNKNKFGFSSVRNLCSDETDFDLFKLYDKQLTSSTDSTFLYFILNHTASGNKSDDRDKQAMCIQQALKKEFQKLPNVIDMGDYNLHNTDEPGYHSLVFNTDENQKFYDPPFLPDHRVSYPADWTSDPDKYASFLTTSTRKKSDDPNSCGTDGGAKSWFDHILLSAPLIDPASKIHYVLNSYHTVGNDGKRVGISVNQRKEPNTSVPAEVADALFQFSNKYPVMLELEVKPTKKGTK